MTRKKYGNSERARKMLSNGPGIIRGRMIPKNFFPPNRLIFAVEAYFDAGSAILVFFGV